MEILYEKYENIKKFITKYRKYKVEKEFLDFQSFKKAIQVEQYVTHVCVDTGKGRKVYIYLFMGNSKYIKTTPQFKRLMDKIPGEPADVIIITKAELSVYINKALLKYPHLKVFNYLHKYFAIEISKGPLCSEHVLLTNNEVRMLCSRELIIHPLSLPSISVNDPQNIWIGGEIGQVVKIISISEITGRTVRYRIVSPDSGKMINIQKMSKKIQDHDDVQDMEDNIRTGEKSKNKDADSDDDVDDAEDASNYVDDVSDDDDEAD